MKDLSNILMILVPIAGLGALIFAVVLALIMDKREVGNSRMKEISDNIAKGAKAFLFSEYRRLTGQNCAFRTYYGYD